MSVDILDFLEDLGSFEVAAGEEVSLQTGSYLASEILIEGKLFVEKAEGRVTLYVTGDVEISGDGTVELAEWDAEKFALYIMLLMQ